MSGAAERAGLRLVTYSRPGYGYSTPRPLGSHPDMTDDAADSLVVLDALGLGDYVTMGWSGGGPRALACAALHAPRCRAAVTLAGVAPFDAPGLDWFAGMPPDSVADWQAAARDKEEHRAFAEAEAAALGEVSGDELLGALSGIIDEVDAAALTGEFAEMLAAATRHAFRQGIEGYLEDNQQETRAWGFDPASITIPVGVWQGAHDKMVPIGHGRWLADTIPGARARLFDDEGHLSLAARMDDILVDLCGLAGLGRAAP